MAICVEIARTISRRGWTQMQAALRLRTSQACVSRVESYRVEQLTFNQLFRYLARLSPHLKVTVSL